MPILLHISNSSYKPSVEVSDNHINSCQIRSKNYSRKHVMSDLKPYVCTYGDCELYDFLFETKKDWYEHEASHHRVVWFCNFDNHQEYHNQADFLTHMKDMHETHLDTARLSSLNDMFQRPSFAQDGHCRLCQKSTAKLINHVSRHLQQLALFAIPRINEVENSADAGKDTRDSGTRKMDDNDEIALDQDSQSSKSTSDRNSVSDSSAMRTVELPSSLTSDSLGTTIVPDSEEVDWDKLIDKFSKAREPQRPSEAALPKPLGMIISLSQSFKDLTNKNKYNESYFRVRLVSLEFLISFSKAVADFCTKNFYSLCTSLKCIIVKTRLELQCTALAGGYSPTPPIALGYRANKACSIS